MPANRILMNKRRSRMKAKTGQEERLFVKDTGISNTIFIIRMLSENATEVQKDVYMCFINYTMAFDKIRQKDLFKLLSNLDTIEMYIRIIRNLY